MPPLMLLLEKLYEVVFVLITMSTLGSLAFWPLLEGWLSK